MILTIFRSRLHPGNETEYESFVKSTSALAERSPGFLGHKMYFAPDGERLTLVEFDSVENQRAWSLSAEHRAAAKAGRMNFYETYRIQICRVMRDSTFVRKHEGVKAPSSAGACPFQTAA
ncbi:MAG: antibiotic biosynthesis monooxygenase [Aquincola sp.]|nr:antibiotic biosynthesis monooxygenase [Aquincola sp.]